MIFYIAAPYILMLGISFIVFSGLWIVEMYDSYVTYPNEAFIYLVLGICMTMIAYLIIQRESKRVTQITNNVMNDRGAGKDRREFINKLWTQKDKLGAGLIVISLVMLAAMFIFEINMAFNLLQLPLFVGLTGFAFLYIMKDEDQEIEESDLKPKSHKMQYLLRLIDYRKHPFSIAMILFIMIVLTFMLSKHFGFELSLETSGNPRYVMSLPSGVWLLAELVFACGFIYIIQHCDFFGIRQAKQSGYKVMLIHFGEIILCGAVFLIWLMILIVALFERY